MDPIKIVLAALAFMAVSVLFFILIRPSFARQREQRYQRDQAFEAKKRAEAESRVETAS